MSLISSKGRPYQAVVQWPRVIMWRPVSTRVERRDWPNGAVIHVVDLPVEERPNLECTCPRARYHSEGAWGCPHALAAMRCVCGVVQPSGAEGGQGGAKRPFAEGAEGHCHKHSVRRDVTGSLVTAPSKGSVTGSGSSASLLRQAGVTTTVDAASGGHS
jgi:hypothetical protein